MAGIDIISDSTGKEIVAAIQSTDVAQARILEINTAAESKKNEVLESIPEDYRNIVNEVGSLKSDLDDLINEKSISLIDNGFITTNGETVNLNSVITSSNYKYAIVECNADDEFIVNGVGGSSPRLWCFIDSENNVLENSSDSFRAESYNIKAPTNASKLIVNINKSSSTNPFLIKGKYIIANAIDDIKYNQENRILGKNVFDDSIFSNASGSTIFYFIKLEPNEYYTMSTDCDSSGSAVVFFLSGKTQNNVSTSTNGVYKNRPITVKSDGYGYVTVAYRTQPNYPNLLKYYWQIEKGSSATEYNKYVSNISNELNKKIDKDEVFSTDLEIEYYDNGLTSKYSTISLNQNGFSYTNFVKVCGGKTLSFVNIVATSSVAIQTFDEKKNAIDNIILPVSGYNVNYDLALNRNVCFVRFTKRTNQIASVSYKEEIKLLNGNLFENMFYFGKNPNADRPVITFIDDDARKEYFTILKPIFDKYGIKGTTAVISHNQDDGNEAYMTLSQLTQLKNDGYDICSHTYSHAYNIFNPQQNDNVTDEQIYNDYVTSIDWLKINGFNSEGLVFPWGSYGSKYERFIKLAIKAGFQYACDTVGGANETDILDTFKLNRYFITNAKGLDDAKSKIDDCVKNGSWLIMSTHIYNTDEISSTLLEEVVSYAVNSGALIKTYAEGFEIKRNICSIGYYNDKSNRLYIGRNGRILNN